MTTTKAPSRRSMPLAWGFAVLLLGVLLLGVLSLALPARSEAQSANYYLKIPLIPGEATGQHVGEIVVLTFSMSFGQPALCGNLLITKNIDSASVPLALHAIQGAPIAMALLTGESITAVPSRRQDFFKMTLQSVSVSSLSILDNSGAPPAIEQLVLKAQFIRLEISRPRPDGTFDGFSTADINCATAKAG